MDRQKAVKQQGQKRNLYLHAKNTSTLSYVRGGGKRGKGIPDQTGETKRIQKSRATSKSKSREEERQERIELW